MLTTTRVPVTMWVGTMVRTPFDSMAGLNEPDAVCPFIAGSVSVISSVTFCGISMETGDAFVQGEIDHHAFLEIFLVVADHVGRHLHLVVSLLVHEMKAVAILIEVARIRGPRHGRARPGRWSCSAAGSSRRQKSGAYRPGSWECLCRDENFPR